MINSKQYRKILTLVCHLMCINPEKYQIIIADCSTDNTRELIKNYNKSISVVDGGLPSVGRNKGASLCSSELLLFIDADMDLSNLCLSELAIL